MRRDTERWSGVGESSVECMDCSASLGCDGEMQGVAGLAMPGDRVNVMLTRSADAEPLTSTICPLRKLASIRPLKRLRLSQAGEPGQ